MVYHLAASERQPLTPLCPPEYWRSGDVIVPTDEANNPDGRHFNCVNCHKRLTGGNAHALPPNVDGEAT